MARNEALTSDVNKYADLAVAACPAGWLSAKHPRARHSFRLNEILLPQGFHSEIRLALRDQGGWLWGALVLFREDPNRLFDDYDAAAVCVGQPADQRRTRLPGAIAPQTRIGTWRGRGRPHARQPDNRRVC